MTTLESTVVIIDSSEFSRNGDYAPSRLEAQNDAVSILVQAKTQANPEATVALISLESTVLCTLGTDVNKIIANLLHHSKGSTNIIKSINVASLVLKHRQNKALKQRIVVFIASPVLDSVDNLVSLGKKLKKNNVAVDVVLFGEIDQAEQTLQSFVSAVDNAGNRFIQLTKPLSHCSSRLPSL